MHAAFISSSLRHRILPVVVHACRVRRGHVGEGYSLHSSDLCVGSEALCFLEQMKYRVTEHGIPSLSCTYVQRTVLPRVVGAVVICCYNALVLLLLLSSSDTRTVKPVLLCYVTFRENHHNLTIDLCKPMQQKSNPAVADDIDCLFATEQS